MLPDPFKYVVPKPDMLPHFEAVAETIAAAYAAIQEHVPSSPERTLAIRRLQEARMWANAAISFEGRPTPT
jgi:hypothetical protein